MFQNMQEVSNLINKVVSEPEIIIKNPSPMSEKDYIAGKKLNDKKMGEVGVRQDENIIKVFHANEKRIKNLDLLAKKEVIFDGRDAHTPYTQAQSLDGRLVGNNISSNTDSIIPQSATSLENSEPEIIRENPKAINDKDFMLYKQLGNKKMADVGIRNDEGTNIIFHANKKNVSKSNYFKKNKQMLVETPSAKAAPTRSNHCADKSNDLSRDSKVLSTSANDIMPQKEQSDTETKQNTQDSALERIKQKIEAYAQKGFGGNTKAKQQSIDKGGR